MIFDSRPLYVLRLSTREHYRHTAFLEGRLQQHAGPTRAEGGHSVLLGVALHVPT
jgi:hypothetical protein